jgi:hypothetical protein
MTKSGAVPPLLFAITLFSGGAVAMAEGPAPKGAAQAVVASKPGQGAKSTSSADPFEEASPSMKPGPRPTTVPTKALPAAAPAAAPAQNLPSKELEAFMKSFEGSWKCDTKFAAGSMGAGSQAVTARTDMTIKKEFGGFSWHGEFRLAKTTTTTATSGMFQIGYSAGSRQATFLSYDSMGSAMMGAGTLAGDSVTFAEEGFLKGVKVRVRETLAVKGPRKIQHRVEIDQGNGYQPMAEDTCSK